MKNNISLKNFLNSRLILILFFGIIVNITVEAQVYVNVAATGAHNGSSWTNAYTNLKDAITNTSSGEIWVAQGDYMPTSNDDPTE